MPDPLPDLGAADFCGGGVFHQVIERHAAGAAQPGIDIADPDIHILPQAGLGDRAVGDGEKIRLDSGVNKRMRKLQFTLLDRQRDSRGQDRDAAALQSPAVREHGQERRYRELSHAAVEVCR